MTHAAPAFHKPLCIQAKYQKGHCKSPTDLKLLFYLGHILLIQLIVIQWLQLTNNNRRGGHRRLLTLNTKCYEQKPRMPRRTYEMVHCLQTSTQYCDSGLWSSFSTLTYKDKSLNLSSMFSCIYKISLTIL